MIITYTDKQFTLNVTDEQGDTILEMSAADVQFKMDLAHGRPPRRITPEFTARPKAVRWNE